MPSDTFITRFRLLGLTTALLAMLSGGGAAGSRAAEGGAAEHLTVRVRASDLRQGLRRASASIGSAKTAAHDWNRVLLEAGPASVTLVGTDGRRLTVVELAGLDPPRKAAGPSVATSLSMNAVQMALEVLDGLDGEVSVDVSPDRLAIAQGKVELRMPTARARFPDWRQVIPKVEDGVAIKVNAGQLLLAVTQAEATSGGGGERPAAASMKLSRNKLAVTAGLADGGPAGSELAVAYDGDAKALGFNPSYLRSFLGLLEKDKAVTMVLHGPRDAILFVTDDGCRFVLMPIGRAE